MARKIKKSRVMCKFKEVQREYCCNLLNSLLFFNFYNILKNKKIEGKNLFSCHFISIYIKKLNYFSFIFVHEC